jgi:hypothetical protein
MKKFAFIAVLAALFTGTAAVQAKENVSAGAVKALVGVAAPEIPAAVVKMMKDAPKASRASVVSALVRNVAKTNPAAVRSVIVAIAKADPSMAAVATSVAARIHPNLVGEYVIAACSAAPKHAAEIIAVSSTVTVASRAALAEQVAGAVASVDAAILAREASEVRVTITSGDAATGGTVYYSAPSGGGSIGFTLNGDEVLGDPTGVPGTDGLDSDRYADAGS